MARACATSTSRCAPGEILGIAGVAGNGQDEFFAALSGETLAEAPGQVLIDGEPAGRLGITARRLRNAAFVPEERNGHAAVPNLALSDNTLLSRHATGGLDRGGFVLLKAAKSLAQVIIKAFDVRVGGPDPAARTLSGGNLQKFLVGREILREPAVLVINQPTWGVDAAACRVDPPGHPRPCGPRRGGAADQPGPRRAVRHLRPARRDPCRRILRGRADRRDQPRRESGS